MPLPQLRDVPFLISLSSKLKFYGLINDYYFDMDNPAAKSIGKFDIEYTTTEKSDVKVHNLFGYITNIKLYDIYNDSLSKETETK